MPYKYGFLLRRHPAILMDQMDTSIQANRRDIVALRNRPSLLLNNMGTRLSALLLIAGLGLTINGYSQPFLTNGLVAYYPFNGNANDATGHGNDGTVVGATLAADRFGTPNRAYSFNGANSMILLPDTLFGATDAAWTISVWITTNGPGHWTEQKVFTAVQHKSWVNFEFSTNSLD